MPKRTFIELEEMICESLKLFPKTDWELSERLDMHFNTVKARLKRLEGRGVVYKVNKLWYWIPPERRTIQT